MVNFQNNDEINFGESEHNANNRSLSQNKPVFKKPTRPVREFGGSISSRPKRPTSTPEGITKVQRPPHVGTTASSVHKKKHEIPSRRPQRPTTPNIQRPVKQEPVIEPEEVYDDYDEKPTQVKETPEEERLRLAREQNEILREQLKAQQKALAERELQAKTTVTPPIQRPLPKAYGEDEENQNQGRKGKGRKNSKKLSRKEKSKKAKGDSDFAGERKKRLIPIIAFWGVIVIMSGAGLKSMFFPSSGPTPAQVAAVAKDAVGVKGFPVESGRQFATDFAKIFFTFDNTSTTSDVVRIRKEKLSQYISEDLLNTIDVSVMPRSSSTSKTNKDKTEVVTPDGPVQEEANSGSSETPRIAQNVTYGPYVVKTTEISDSLATFTLKIGTDKGSLFYVDVPVKYDSSQYSLTVAGPLSFSMNEQNVGSSKADDYTAKYKETEETKQLEEDFKPDLQEYLKAWSQSNTTIINRYITDNATDNAKRGLQNAVEFNSLSSLDVGFPDADVTSKATGEAVVQWKDPKSNLYYTQTYRLKLLKNSSTNKWQIYDIVNFSEQYHDSATAQK